MNPFSISLESIVHCQVLAKRGLQPLLHRHMQVISLIFYIQKMPKAPLVQRVYIIFSFLPESVLQCLGTYQLGLVSFETILNAPSLTRSNWVSLWCPFVTTQQSSILSKSYFELSYGYLKSGPSAKINRKFPFKSMLLCSLYSPHVMGQI